MTIKDLRKDTINTWVELNRYVETFNILIDLHNVGGVSIKVTANINGDNDTVIGCGITNEGELLNLLLSYEQFLFMIEEGKTMKNITGGYEEVEGGTHDMPALIANLTDEPLFFYDGEGTFTNVDDIKGVDFFNGKKGCFMVKSGHKAIAEWKVRMHDDYGIKWR